MLTYEDSTHSYFWFGVEIPSLTELMGELGWGRDFSGVPEPVLQAARIRGLQAHEAIERYLRGDAKFADSLSESSEPYFDSFLAAESDLSLSDAGESELVTGGWCGYGTTLDRLEPEVIYEWKTTSRIHPSVWIQMAGQDYAANKLALESYMPTMNRVVVHLLKTGKKAKIMPDPGPINTSRLWQNSLEAREWKSKVRWS